MWEVKFPHPVADASGHTCNPYPILFICGRHSARNRGLEGSLEVLITIHFNLSTKQVRKGGRCDSYPKSETITD